MIVSRRERWLAIGSACAVGIAVLYWYVLTPIVDGAQAMDKKSKALQTERAQTTLTIRKGEQLAPKWEQILASGLRSDAADAESQVMRAVPEWCLQAELTLVSMTSERVASKAELREIAFQATCIGGIEGMSRFLYSLENAKIPIKVKEITVTARREGMDDLQFLVRISTVYRQPAPAGTADASRAKP